MSRSRRRLFPVFFCLMGLAQSGWAQTEAEILAQVPASGNVRAFAIERRDGKLSVASCTSAGCDWARRVDLAAPAEVVARATSESVSIQKIGEGRTAAVLRVGDASGAEWASVIVGAPAAEQPPRVKLDNWLGLRADELGERHGLALHIEEAEDQVHLVVGDLDGEVSLCGREALLRPRVLLASDMDWHRVKWHPIAAAERSAAIQLPAQQGAAEPSKVLRVLAASSARGAPQALTDDDPTTWWAEARGGDGRGEFVVMQASEHVPLHGFQLSWPAQALPSGPSAGLVAPKDLWIVTDQSVYSVTVPQSAAAGSALFALPAPVQTSCVAVVLESGQELVWPDGADAKSAAEPGAGSKDVALSEFRARVVVGDDQLALAVKQLDAASEEAEAALELVLSVAPRALPLLISSFAEFSPVGRARALLVYASLPCQQSAPALVAAMSHEPGSEGSTLTEQLRACGESAVSELAAASKKAAPDSLPALGTLLAELDPDKALRTLVTQAKRSSSSRRKALRVGLRAALADPRTDARVRGYLTGKHKLSQRGQLEILRGLNSRLAVFADVAEPRIEEMLEADPSFETRYLAVEPLAALAPQRPGPSKRLGELLATDPEPAVRAHAARVAPATPVLSGRIVKATEDPHVRVREAAVLNIGEQRVERGADALIRRVQNDEWPLVRGASIRALAELAPSERTVNAVADAVKSDTSPTVRRPAVVALGRLSARSTTALLRERLSDEEEDVHVRAAAAGVLGQFCDRASVDVLSEYTQPLQTMGGTESQNILGRAALQALGRISPPDLDSRLQRFEGPQVPGWVKRVVLTARHHPDACHE